MVLVLGLSAIVFAAVGAAIGALSARYLPKVVLYMAWTSLLVVAVFLVLHGRTLDPYDQIGANMLVFAVLLPILIGSVVTGLRVRRKAAPEAGDKSP